MVLCFGFVTKAVLITHPCFIAEEYLHSIKVFSLSHSAPTVSRLGVDKRLGGNAAGTADPTDARDIPYHMTSHSALKLEGSFAGVAIAQGLAGHRSADSERLLLHLTFFYLAFSPAFTLLKSLSLPPSLLASALPILSHIAQDEGGAVWGSAACWGQPTIEPKQQSILS